ncbi:MAG: pyridoxal-phosphate dependent enzyme, partial [Anaerolineae bacterium]
MIDIFCPECGAQESLSPQRWRCDCGGAWEPVERADFDPAQIDAADFSLWRYRRVFGSVFEGPVVRLGAGWTPLLPLVFGGREVSFKLEYMAPTASFKDRGTAVMIDLLARQGARHVIDDSSGNAGASVAAYAARAGIQAEIFVPAHASPAKQAQIAVYGAEVRPVSGPRANAKWAAWEAVGQGAVLASHSYHPGFVLGQQSVAWELWEQLGRREPDWYVVPVGQGLHLLGVWLGFRRLRAAGLVERLPRLVAVQPALLAPLCHAWEAGLETVPLVEPAASSVAEGPALSVAEGLAIAEPVRGRRLLQALRETGGMCVTVQEEAILQAQRQLARQGLYVEPTSATAVAALEVVFQQAAAG